MHRSLPYNRFIFPTRQLVFAGQPLASLIVLLISIAFNHSICFAQPDSSLVSFGFLKESDSITDGTVHFNVLRIKNTSKTRIEGEINFSAPQNWTLIASPIPTISLSPGEEYSIPVRLSVPSDIVGGISYIFSGVLKINDEYIYANSYIFVISRSRWMMELDKNTIYINEFKSRDQFGIKITNLGNKVELIRLKFDIGNQVSIVELGPSDSIKYVNVNAYSDTIFTYTIESNRDLSYAESHSSSNNWKAATVLLEASTSDNKISSSVRVKKLASCETTVRRQQVSPLNFEMLLYNLMSSQPLKMHNKLYGSVLFKDYRSLGYSININNIYFDLDKNNSFTFDDNIRFLLNYQDKNITARAGDNIGGGMIHSINGRGIDIQAKIGKNQAQLTAVQNPINSNRGIAATYSRNIGAINTNLGFTYDDNPRTNNYSAYSISPGVGFRFLKYNSFNAQAVLSNVSYSNLNNAEKDTNLIGFGYRFYYRFNTQKFRLQLAGLNSSLNYLRNSGVNRYNLDSHVEINPKMRLFAYYERNQYTATKYPYNFFNPPNENINDHGRLLISYNQGKTIYQIGPQYVSAKRTFNDTYSGFYTDYTDYTPGLYGSATYRISNIKSLSPNITINNLNFMFSTNDTLFSNYSVHNKWFYSVGVNYYDYIWRINVYYTSGSSSDLYKNVLTEAEPSVSQAFHVRPSYERYFRDNTIRVSGYMNFSYYTPSGRENFVLNVSSDFFLKKYWQLFFSFNVFSTTRVDEELGRISNRNFNTIIGIRKAFDIQQPRLKYYDITINCFNDLNGNGIRDAQEKPISNILITITRSFADSMNAKVAFPQTELLTNAEGQICYNNMPEGSYVLELSPLSNLENMFFLDGQKQVIQVDSKGEFNLPLVESFKVKGQIQIERDPNSTEGRITLDGIKITALSVDGYTYSTLTDKFGQYILNLPHDKEYTITMSNVFNENFVIEQQEYTIRFGQSRSIRIDFRVHERKREIKFDGGDQYFQFKSVGN